MVLAERREAFRAAVKMRMMEKDHDADQIECLGRSRPNRPFLRRQRPGHQTHARIY